MTAAASFCRSSHVVSEVLSGPNIFAKHAKGCCMCCVLTWCGVPYECKKCDYDIMLSSQIPKQIAKASDRS
eukprot:scaffold209073_cov21-Prasinocladus_malaysianus.AAC.1